MTSSFWRRLDDADPSRSKRAGWTGAEKASKVRSVGMYETKKVQTHEVRYDELLACQLLASAGKSECQLAIYFKTLRSVNF